MYDALGELASRLMAAQDEVAEYGVLRDAQLVILLNAATELQRLAITAALDRVALELDA